MCLYLPGCSVTRWCWSAPGCLGFLLGGFDKATEICLSPTRLPSSAIMAADAPVYNKERLKYGLLLTGTRRRTLITGEITARTVNFDKKLFLLFWNSQPSLFLAGTACFGLRNSTCNKHGLIQQMWKRVFAKNKRLEFIFICFVYSDYLSF